MANSTKGVQVSWGIPASAKTDIDEVVTGIVQDFSISADGNMNEITDEDGDIVSVVYHGTKNSISFSTLVIGNSATIPTKGTRILFSADLNGITLNTAGETYVDTAEISYAGTDTTSVSISATHFPLVATA